MSFRALSLAAALAALSLTAFAPAPLPRRPSRDGKDSVAVKDLIGEWKATELIQTGSGAMRREPAANGVTHVSITATQWVFNKHSSPTTYDLRIDHLKR